MSNQKQQFLDHFKTQGKVVEAADQAGVKCTDVWRWSTLGSPTYDGKFHEELVELEGRIYLTVEDEIRSKALAGDAEMQRLLFQSRLPAGHPAVDPVPIRSSMPVPSLNLNPFPSQPKKGEPEEVH